MKSVAEIIKVILACVVAGGGSAAVVGKLEAQGVRAELEAHETGIHPEAASRIDTLRQEFIGQASEAREAAQQAEMSAQRSNVMLEMLLRKEGLRPPPAPMPTDVEVKEPDGGTRDGGK